MRHVLSSILVFLVAFAPLTVRAEQIGLLPGVSQIEFRAYGLGLIPFDGKFTRFHGWIRYDPANTQVCQVMREIDAASLAMENETIRVGIIGPEFMDVSRFP